MAVTPFEVEAEQLGDDLRSIAVRGELDLETAASLEQLINTVAEYGPRGILLDLTDCEFIDSTGIALLVNTWKRLDGGEQADRSCKVAICAPGIQVRRVIEITGLSGTIPVYQGRSQAEQELAPVS